MGRNKLEESNKKTKLSISINTELINIVKSDIDNISKYMEWLIYQDLNKNDKLEKDFRL